MKSHINDVTTGSSVLEELCRVSRLQRRQAAQAPTLDGIHLAGPHVSNPSNYGSIVYMQVMQD